MTSYVREPFDDLPFGTEAKARRYASERYAGAVGRNWYTSDPSLQRLMRRHLGAAGLAWATPVLEQLGAMMGGPIAERAEETDRNPPRLEKYDRWGRDVSQVVMPATFEASRRDLIEHNVSSASFVAAAREAGVDARPLFTAWAYLLDQAEIGMMCALGTGGDMVVRLAEEFAPTAVRDRVRELFAAGEYAGEAVQMLTERTGGSDLAALETTATLDGDRWRLNGFKWFASNANGSAFVVLAKPVGAPDSIRGIAPFLVLRDRSRRHPQRGAHPPAQGQARHQGGGVGGDRARRRRGLPARPDSADRRSGRRHGAEEPAARSGMARMMELTNGARLGIAMMGLGCARRALVESLCYARTREAFGSELVHHPLMQRKLAELIVEVEAAQVLVFDGYLGPRLRIGAPLIKLRAARLGITAASDAIEIHGGNGYIEQWPVARILRDAQVNTVWEGPDNILCLDVRRAIERDGADQPLLDRLRQAIDRAPRDDPSTRDLVATRIDDVARAIEAWRALDRATGEARLYPLAQLMVDVYAAALLLEQAGWERDELGSDRGSLVARLYARDHLAEHGPLRGIDAPAEELARFKDLVDGAFIE